MPVPVSNIILGFPNYVDATYYSVAFSNGSWEAALPLTNLRDPLLSKPARSTSASTTHAKLDVDLGTPRDVRGIFIPKSNISRVGKARVRGASDSGFSNVLLDTGWQDVWRRAYEFGTLPWGHPSSWDWKISAEDAVGQTFPFVHIAEAAVVARYWRIEVDDSTNAAGYIDLNRLFLCPGWQPSRNFAYGAQFGFETDTEMQKTLGGAMYYDKRRPRRVLRLTIEHLPEGEALAQAYEMQRRLGIDLQVMVVINPEDTVNMHRRAFLATMRQLAPIEWPFFGRHSVSFEFMEVIA